MIYTLARSLQETCKKSKVPSLFSPGYDTVSKKRKRSMRLERCIVIFALAHYLQETNKKPEVFSPVVAFEHVITLVEDDASKEKG